MNELVVRDRRRLGRRICLPLLRRITGFLLENCLGLRESQLGIFLVAPKTMARLNAKFLRHEGPTDVITFDHREVPGSSLFGEIYLCPEVADAQAAQFRTSMEEEVVRYVVHGVLHLLGYDDLAPLPRRRMKREEARLLKILAAQHPLRDLTRPASGSTRRSQR